MKKVIEYLGLSLLIAFMLATTFIYFTPHLGWRVDVVASGSRESYFKVGALLVTRPVSPEAVKVGDIITLKPTMGEAVITHRVTGIEKGSLFYYMTKENANSSSDAIPVPARDMVGKICLYIPFLGYVTEFLKTPWGYLLGLVLPGIIILAIYARSIWQEFNKRKTGKIAGN